MMVFRVPNGIYIVKIGTRCASIGMPVFGMSSFIQISVVFMRLLLKELAETVTYEFFHYFCEMFLNMF